MNDHDLQRAYRRIAARQPRGPTCLSADDLDRLARRDAPQEMLVKGLDHVMACPQCLREFELLRAVRAAAGADRPIPGLASKTWVWQTAAVVLLGLGVATVAPLFRKRGPAEDPSRGADSTVGLIEPTAMAGAPLRFVWHPVPGALSYDVEILDEADQPVAGATVADTVWSPADSVKLIPGQSYRWWVAATTGAGAEIRALPRRFSVPKP
jgi:hypothetical protein